MEYPFHDAIGVLLFGSVPSADTAKIPGNVVILPGPNVTYAVVAGLYKLCI